MRSWDRAGGVACRWRELPCGFRGWCAALMGARDGACSSRTAFHDQDGGAQMCNARF